mmetsp:Transcript_142304/g.248147  ORF Transcript_142304/g.248147 Transcript_142304/m.248147 type:complete len:93 (-) Transcript_142304:206-484(-)
MAGNMVSDPVYESRGAAAYEAECTHNTETATRCGHTDACGATRTSLDRQNCSGKGPLAETGCLLTAHQPHHTASSPSLNPTPMIICPLLQLF